MSVTAVDVRAGPAADGGFPRPVQNVAIDDEIRRSHNQDEAVESEPSVGEYTESLMQLVEAQIVARLDTEAGRKILLEEAAFYGDDLEAAKAAIVRCARNKVKARLHKTCEERISRPSTERKRGKRKSRRRSKRRVPAKKSVSDTDDTVPQTESQGKDTSDRNNSQSSQSSSAVSRSGSGSGPPTSDEDQTNDTAKLERELVAEAQALGLRREDIPFMAKNLANVNMRRPSRTRMKPLEGPPSTAQSPFKSPTPSLGGEEEPRRVGSGRGPVFGQPLKSALRCNSRPLLDNHWVPDVVQISLEYLNGHALSVEGLWRIPGNVGNVKALRVAWDSGQGVAYADEQTRPHDVCSLLLLYFRELPGTVFGREMASQFVNDQDVTNEDEIVDRLSGLVGTLPQENRDTLHAMIHHFKLLAANSSENMMTSENIATCVWASQGYYQSMKHMIDNYDLIFYMYG